jgi:signal transduction histidine kinase
VPSLSEFVAAALEARASQLASHWLARARAATPRAGADPPTGGADADAADAVVRALAAGLTEDARPAGEVMRLGWAAGEAAHAAGLAVTHVQRDADLLLAVALAEAERAAAAAPAGAFADAAAPPATAPPAEALAVARRLQRLGARYAQAAVAGFLVAQRRALRARWRTLRHDLRNPIGTIQSALALMDDEALPAETRQHPRMRAMVARNAGTLAQLVADGLDDRAATTALAREQVVSLRALADAARREVREAARDAGCEVDVARVPDDPPAAVEPAALELALTVLLLAGLARARRGDVLRVERTLEADAPALRVARERADGPGGPPVAAADGGTGDAYWDAAGVRLAASLLAAVGGRLAADRAHGGALDDAPALRVVLPDGREGAGAP